MLDMFRNWINMILAAGILFTVIRIIMPNTKLKKYIYSLMAIVTIIVVLNPIVALIKKGNIKEGIKDILLDMSAVETLNMNYTDLSNYENINKNNVKENFKSNIVDDMKQKLSQNMENDINVKIDITDSYNIERVYVNVIGNTDYDIASFISQEYDIDKTKIVVKKGG